MPHRLLLLTLALAALATACGFLEADRFSGSRSPTGVAPFEDLGAPRFCAPPHLVWSPASEPRGFCVPDLTDTGTGCATDSDCRNRERCVCGRCTVQYCDSATQCGPGQTCSFAEHRCHTPCQTLDDCTLEEDRCDRGVCTQRCVDDTECQAGESCSASSGQCVASDCASDAECPAGQHCVIQREPWDLRAPTAVMAPGPTLYLEARRGTSDWEIWRAVSQDGLAFTFDPGEPVLRPQADEEGRVGAPALLATTGGSVLYFEVGDGTAIRRAVAPDGVSFARDPAAAVLVPDREWEAGAVRAPSAIRLPDGRVALFYEGGTGASLGLALSADGITFAKRETPILTPQDVSDPKLWREVSHLQQPAARLTSDASGRPVVSLYFAAFGIESAAALEFGVARPIPANYSIGYAAATVESLAFEPSPLNPIFDQVREFLTHDSELSPTVLDTGESFLLYYTRADAAALEFDNLGVAINPARF